MKDVWGSPLSGLVPLPDPMGTVEFPVAPPVLFEEALALGSGTKLLLVILAVMLADREADWEAEVVELLGGVAPVAAMRASRWSAVVQVTEVPGLSTSGRAAHTSSVPQGLSANLPWSHLAKEPCTHALSPSLHGESGVRVVNFWFKAMASSPFCLRKSWRRPRRMDLAVASAAQVRERRAENFMLNNEGTGINLL